MNESPSLEDVISIALQAHRGQVDKAGQPYICHPLRLMLQMETMEERMTAVLHDTVEDSDVTIADLQSAGLSDEVVQAIELLTHQDGVDYYEYIAQIKANPLARKVKLADLRDNMNLARIASPTDKDRKRLEKYQKAVEFLTTNGEQ